MMNKKGLSQVVTTVLIILIVLAAIILIWVAVRPTIEGAGDQITADCVSIELNPVSCDITNNNVRVGRGADGGDLAGVKILVRRGEQVLAYDATGTLPDSLGSSLMGSGGTLAINDRVSVAAVVGDDITCPASITEIDCT
jgi:hypothetical protein